MQDITQRDSEKLNLAVSNSNKLDLEKPSLERQGAEKSSLEGQGAEKSSLEGQGAEKPSLERQGAEKKNAEKTSPENLNTENQYVLRAAHAGDDQALLNLISVPMTTRGVMLSFQRNPSYFNASQVVYTVNDHLVIEDRHTGELVACCSNGYRPCFINGQVREIRYACDLRINAQYRGASLMKMLGEHVGQMERPDFNQIIIFNDNIAARKAVQTGKAGLPDYHEDDLVETLTLTGFKRNPDLAEYLQKLPDQYDVKTLKVMTAQPSHVALMNGFIRRMADHYNFLPAYDFYELLYHSAYFQGLKIQDFQLYFDGNELIGMFGLWSQSSFKQSVILDYGVSIGVFRPLYNFWARLVGAMQLPRKGQAFKYHALHSLLCDPDQLVVHDRMLRDALVLSKKRGVNAINYTLSHRDPRQQLNRFYKGELLTGMHGFLCNTRDPRPDFDIARIPYLEVGRI